MPSVTLTLCSASTLQWCDNHRDFSRGLSVLSVQFPKHLLSPCSQGFGLKPHRGSCAQPSWTVVSRPPGLTVAAGRPHCIPTPSSPLLPLTPTPCSPSSAALPHMPTHLQPYDPLVHVLPHAHLHIKLRELLVSLCAGCADVLARRHVLGEVENVPLH